MAKLSDDGRRSEYSSYDEYVNIQDSRYHDYDCPNCLALNMDNVMELDKRGIVFTNLLDVGCRDAAYFDNLEKRNIKCTGIDISPRSVEYSKSKNRNVILGDVNNLKNLVQEKFDVIISNHSLEHFLNADIAMVECYNILNDGGYILIKIPNEGKKLKNNSRFDHVRTFTGEELRKLVEDANFKVEVFELNNKNEFFVLARK